MTNPAESTLNTAQVTLSEFLLARIDEDEADLHLKAGRPDRIDDECRAKRRIVTRYVDMLAEHFAIPAWERYYGEQQALTHMRENMMTATQWDIRDLAAVYSDHPDYREEWS